jgi:hypothetical protein
MLPQNIPCQFRNEAHHLGWLDDDADSDSLPMGAVVDLPIYLARALALNAAFVLPLTPRVFGEQMRKSLQADPEVINLREKNEFYFVHGLKVADLTEDHKLPSVLLTAFLARHKRMLDTCLTGADGDPGGLTHRLSSTESNCASRRSRAASARSRRGKRARARADLIFPPPACARAPLPSAVFCIGLASTKDYQRWKARRAEHITASDVIKHAPKRARMAAGGRP